MRYCTTCGGRVSDEIAFCPSDGMPTQPLVEATPAGIDPLIGQVIDGRYRIDRQIGEGGMGIVYLATHSVLNKRLALKVLRGEMAKDQDVVQRFIQEAQSASAIGHENIISISDFGRLPDGAVYFVMEYLDGQALTDLIAKGGSLPMREAVSIVRQIASALGAAHACGIVHRDLKPDNIFVIRRGEGEVFVKVLDFGIAKVGSGSNKLTRTGMIFGTPHYMSPEQAAGQGVDRRTDIYALGVIMYEMFTGRVPFDADTFMAILSKQMFEAPIPPSQLRGREIGALEPIILKALAKKPEQRYQDMDALSTDLAHVAAGGAVQIGAAPGEARPSAALADELEPPSRTEMNLSMAPPSLPKNRAPLIVGAILGGLVVVGGIVGAAVTFGGGDDAVSPRAATTRAVPAVAPAPAPAPAPPAAVQPVVAPVGTPPPAVPTTVLVRSEPPGAQVLVGGLVVGTTPIDVPVPTDGAVQELELRLARHAAQRIELTASTAGPLDVRLVAESTPRSSAGRDRRRVVAAPAPVEPAPAAPRPRTTSTRASSEVLDPWGN